jgi:hypothetical protein
VGAVEAIAALVGLLVLGAAGIALNYTLLRGLRDQWRRFPPDRRKYGLVGGAICAMVLVPALVVAAIAPWGEITILYVSVALGPLFLVLWLPASALLRRRASEPSREERRS